MQDYGMKQAVCNVVPFLLKGVCDKNDEEDSTIPKVTKTIGDQSLSQGETLHFSRKTSCLLEIR